MDRNYFIDSDNGTVDGSPARIGPSDISVDFVVNGTNYTMMINRVTGRGGISSSLGLLFTGTCEKATQLKF
jgi:hypothetical protein